MPRSRSTPHPAGSTGAPTLLVDLSNVCHHGDLGCGDRPTLARLDRLLAAWRTSVDADPSVLCVADRSLRRLLGAGDQRRLARMATRREVLVPEHGVADNVLLRLAEEHPDAALLSRDAFMAYRRSFPWIDAELDRFYTWSVDKRGVVLRTQVKVGDDFAVSRAEEVDELRSHGFPGRAPTSHPVLRHRYRCVSEGPCLTRDFHPEMLRVAPQLRDGSVAVCPGCGGPLEVVDSAVLGVEIKVRVDEHEVARFTLHDGAEAILGRDTVPLGDLGTALVASGSLSSVSRDHARVRVAGRQLHVEDVGSRNGTWVAEWVARDGAHGSWQPLEQGAERRVGKRDLVRLGRRVQLVRSGRTFPVAPTHQDDGGPGDGRTQG